jgi:hypothetical protein
MEVNSGNPELDFNRGSSERSALIEGPDSNLGLLDSLEKYKSMLKSARASGSLLGLKFDADDVTDRCENYANLLLGAVGRDVVNKQVRLKEFLHVLLDGCLALVSSHIIFSLGHMRANQQKASTFNLLFMHFLDGGRGTGYLVEANETTVGHSVIIISMLDKSWANFSEFDKHFSKFLFVDALRKALNENVVHWFGVGITLRICSFLMNKNFQIFAMEFFAVESFDRLLGVLLLLKLNVTKAAALSISVTFKFALRDRSVLLERLPNILLSDGVWEISYENIGLQVECRVCKLEWNSDNFIVDFHIVQLSLGLFCVFLCQELGITIQTVLLGLLVKNDDGLMNIVASVLDELE